MGKKKSLRARLSRMASIATERARVKERAGCTYWACYRPVKVDANGGAIWVFPSSVRIFMEVGGSAITEGEFMGGGLAIHALVGNAQGGVERWNVVWIGIVRLGGPAVIGALLEGCVVGSECVTKRSLWEGII